MTDRTRNTSGGIARLSGWGKVGGLGRESWLWRVGGIGRVCVLRGEVEGLGEESKIGGRVK